MVDIQATLRHRGKCTVAAKRDASQVIVGANAADDNLSILGGIRRRQRQRSAIGRNPVFGLGARTVVHRQLMPCLFKMSRHWAAHDAQSDKSYSSHSRVLMFVFT